MLETIKTGALLTFGGVLALIGLAVVEQIIAIIRSLAADEKDRSSRRHYPARDVDPNV